LSAFLKFCVFLALVFGSEGMLLQYLGPAEKLSPAGAPGYVAMAKPLSAPAGASDAIHTIPESLRIARNSEAAPDSSTGGVVAWICRKSSKIKGLSQISFPEIG
jgi:hypothetical protein